jgi:hypothetical protein
VAALALSAVVTASAMAACSDPEPLVARLPRPSTGTEAVVPGQAPVVWVSGQSAAVSTSRLTIVEHAGSKVIVHRLAEGATKFFVLSEGKFVSMPETDALLVEVGTPMCVESLLDERRLVALRVFVGGACGPRP